MANRLGEERKEENPDPPTQAGFRVWDLPIVSLLLVLGTVGFLSSLYFNPLLVGEQLVGLGLLGLCLLILSWQRSSWWPELLIVALFLGGVLLIRYGAADEARVRLPIPVAKLASGIGVLAPGQRLALLRAGEASPIAVAEVLLFGSKAGPLAASDRTSSDVDSVLVAVPVAEADALQALLNDEKTTFYYRLLEPAESPLLWYSYPTSTPTSSPTASPTVTPTPTATPDPRPSFILRRDPIDFPVTGLAAGDDAQLVMVSTVGTNTVTPLPRRHTASYCVRVLALFDSEDQPVTDGDSATVAGVQLGVQPNDLAGIASGWLDADLIWLLEVPTCATTKND